MKEIFTLLFIALTSFGLAADQVPPAKYSLSVGRVYESKPERPEWVFIFGGTGPVRGGETVCKSPAGLKALFKGLPRGSTLDWWPTCSGESEALAGHLEDLKKICTEVGVVLFLSAARFALTQRSTEAYDQTSCERDQRLAAIIGRAGKTNRGQGKPETVVNALCYCGTGLPFRVCCGNGRTY